MNAWLYFFLWAIFSLSRWDYIFEVLFRGCYFDVVFIKCGYTRKDRKCVYVQSCRKVREKNYLEDRSWFLFGLIFLCRTEGKPQSNNVTKNKKDKELFFYEKIYVVW